MTSKRLDNPNYNGCTTTSELLNWSCMPMLDALLKLSGIATNFATAANNVKNISITDKHEVEELLELVFEARKMAERLEKIIEEQLDSDLNVIQSGVFDRIRVDEQKQSLLQDVVETGEVASKLLKNKEKRKQE